MVRKRLRQVKADLTVLSIQPGGELRDQTCVHLPDLSPRHLVCHFSTSLRLPSLRMASFARAISCRLVKQVSSLRSWKVSFLSSANKSIGGTLARTSTALVDTVRYAETILITTPLCAENSFFCYSLLKLEKSQYQNSIFQLNCRIYEKKVITQNYFLHKDLQIWIATFFHKMYIFLFNLKKYYWKSKLQLFLTIICGVRKKRKNENLFVSKRSKICCFTQFLIKHIFVVSIPKNRIKILFLNLNMWYVY